MFMWNGYLLVESFMAGVLTTSLFLWFWHYLYKNSEPFYFQKDKLPLPICGSKVTLEGVTATIHRLGEDPSNKKVYVELHIRRDYTPYTTALYLEDFWNRVDSYNGRPVIFRLDQ